MVVPKFEFLIQKSKLVYRTPDIISQWIRSVFKEGDHGFASFTRPRKPRTTGAPGEQGNQNGYYWAVVLPVISNETGHTSDDLHEIYKSKFSPKRVVRDIDGREHVVPMSTSAMSTNEFTEYLDRIMAHAAEYGISIPPPEKITIT